jgi:epoxide hydrolase
MTRLDVRPFAVEVPQSALDDLRARVRTARWPEPSTAAGWEQGVPLHVMRELCQYWIDRYDWRQAESRLNARPQSQVKIDGLGIHVLHARSVHTDALPLILTHGWPGSVLEWIDLVDPLIDPTAHGGSEADAFHVVIPSLPGYGFSERPSVPGWGIERIALAWTHLMAGLGYHRYGAAGSDWGSSISTLVASHDADHVVGIHLVPPLAGPDPNDELTPLEQSAQSEFQERVRTSSAYGEVHRTAPQTLGYALVDSPTGLCAWMAEKLITWSDPSPGGAHAGGLTSDQILDQVTLYWLTGTAASAARLYAESIDQISRWLNGGTTMTVDVPVGASIFAAEVPRPSRRWAARRYPDIRLWNEHPHGGHFPALEAPRVLVDDLRAFFRPLR